MGISYYTRREYQNYSHSHDILHMWTPRTFAAHPCIHTWNLHLHSRCTSPQISWILMHLIDPQGIFSSSHLHSTAKNRSQIAVFMMLRQNEGRVNIRHHHLNEPARRVFTIHSDHVLTHGLTLPSLCPQPTLTIIFHFFMTRTHRGSSTYS